jgi:hypothetical protein
LPQALDPLSRFVPMREGPAGKKESRASSRARLRFCEIYSLSLYRSVVSHILTKWAVSFQINLLENRAICVDGHGISA